MSAHIVSQFSQHVRLNYAHYPHHVHLLLGLSLLFIVDEDPRKMQFIATLCNKSKGWCVYRFFDDETRASYNLLLFAVFRKLWSFPEQYWTLKLLLSGESPLACVCFPSGRTAAYGGCTYCSALFVLEYLQFSLPLHPSLFCLRSQTLTLILKPECCSVKIFTGRIVHNVFMHNDNACESYSNIKKTETDYSPRLCLGMG